jgi:tetratricopeptide (TPR) repeat protein
VIASATPHTYSLKSVREMLGLSAGTLTRLIDAGFVTPARGPRNEYRFSFQDVVLLRTADQLLANKIPPRKVVKALTRLRQQLPSEAPLTGLRISAVGSDVAVRQGDLQWDAESQQLLMDFEVAPSGGAGAVTFITRPTPKAGSVSPNEGFASPQAGGHSPHAAASPHTEAELARAEALERSDPAAAEAAYRSVIRHAPERTDAYLNLGALLYEAGRLDDALAAYDQGLAKAPREARLHYNRALALEDLGRANDALAAYEACIALADDFADAHFNAARLYEQLGRNQLALRHFSAYRRLQR